MVEYQIGKSKWRRAVGANRWRVRRPVRIRGEQIRAKVRAIDFSGNGSAVKRQRIRRK